jgi:O-antigen/teichoic acid export membrane protein
LEKKTLKDFVLRGSMWTLGGHGIAQLLRFGRSLVLTRLLAPEAFGVMAIVWAVMFALEMFSDIGVGGAIVRDKRGDDPDFLNTAWTMQLARGIILWLIACSLAYPMSVFYNNSELLELIPIAALTVLISGFSSTSIHTSARHMIYGRITLLNLINEVLACAVVIIWAYLSPSAWALVGGALVGRLFLTLASHKYLPGIRNRLRWDISSFKVLFQFGKWVFLSSALHVLYAQSDKLMLGKYISLERLGVYSIAVLLSESVSNIIYKLIHGVFYPAFSRVVQTEPSKLASVYGKARLGIDVVFVFPIAVLMVMGNNIVDFLYDSRYSDAGWMLQLLCIRLIMSASLAAGEVSLFALGHVKYGFFQNVCRVLWIVIGIPVGWTLNGLQGAILAIALSELPVLLVIWFGTQKYRVFSLVREIRTVGFIVLGIGSGMGLLWISKQLA